MFVHRVKMFLYRKALFIYLKQLLLLHNFFSSQVEDCLYSLYGKEPLSRQYLLDNNYTAKMQKHTLNYVTSANLMLNYIFNQN